jgi:hypothetical protein
MSPVSCTADGVVVVSASAAVMLAPQPRGSPLHTTLGPSPITFAASLEICVVIVALRRGSWKAATLLGRMRAYENRTGFGHKLVK